MTGNESGFALECFGLGKRYRRRPPALSECTLRLPAGRICALVGPNGAGKSTLLALAAGLLAPTEGRVEVFGSAALDIHRHRPDERPANPGSGQSLGARLGIPEWGRPVREIPAVLRPAAPAVDCDRRLRDRLRGAVRLLPAPCPPPALAAVFVRSRAVSPWACRPDRVRVQCAGAKRPGRRSIPDARSGHP